PRPARAPATAPAVDLWAVVAAAVADKTGYPVDTLAREQDLERDLGIDSIKRVEIVAAVRDQLPGLPELDPGALGKLATLGDVVAALGAAAGRPTPRPAERPAERPTEPPTEPPEPPEWSERRRVATPPPGLGAPGLWLARWGVIDDRGGVGVALVEQLRRRGIDATLTDRAEEGMQAVIALHGLRPPSDRALAEAFTDARTVARAPPPRRWLAVGDAGSPGRAVLGGLDALARTFAAECVEGGGRAIDLAADGVDPRQVADRIVSELVAGGADLTIAIDREGVRSALGWAPVAPPEPQLPRDTVWVVSGGARGVTLDALLALAPGHPRLLLLGRSADPGDALERLAAAGATARYTSVDLRDADAVVTAVAAARDAWGPIDGVVHGAGVLADGMLERRTSDAGFERVVQTKLGGWRSLLAATRSDPLRWLIAFSSVAATFGNPGQADYALANESLARLCAAEAAARPTCRVAAIGWGPWDGGMVTEAARQRFRALQMPLVDRAAGADAFVRVVAASGSPHLRIVAGGTPDVRRPVRASVRIGPDTHPQLDGHRVGGQVVLPLVLVAEWFGRMGAALAPGFTLRDLRALRGVVVDRWEDGAAFEVVAHPVAHPVDAGWTLELHDALCDGRGARRGRDVRRRRVCCRSAELK
ncbi:MAG: SDR family NAD(P)-dependent oxidoreductase, partial [Myxococcota bacterium]